MRNLWNLALEALILIVDDIHARMSKPGLWASIVELSRQLNGLGTRAVVGKGIELLGAERSRHQVYHLVVAVVSQIDLVPSRVTLLENIPLFTCQVRHRIHRSPVVDHEAVLVALVRVVFRRLVYCVLDL